MSNYVKGTNAEYEIAKIFKENGFIVTRAAGSHGPFDLIAIKETKQTRTKVYFFCGFMQVKKNKRN